MARRAQKDADGTSALSGNGYDSEKVQSFVGRIETLDAERQTIMDAAKEECFPIADDIKEIKDEAKAAGIPKKELSAILSKRKKLRAVEAIRAKLEPTEQDNFDQLESALGMFKDTPLGKSALSKAKNGAHASA